MIVEDTGIRVLADSTVQNGGAQSAGDAMRQIEDSIFSLGFVNTLIYAAVVGAATFVIIKLLSLIHIFKTIDQRFQTLCRELNGENISGFIGVRLL